MRATCQNGKYKKKMSLKSKEVLSDDNIRSKMSIKASLNNMITNKSRSEALKRYYSNQLVKEGISKSTKLLWEDEKYQEKVSNGLSKKWEDPQYRGKIIGSRYRPVSRSYKIERFCIKNNITFKHNIALGSYNFNYIINNNYLLDLSKDNVKKLFVEHYFKDYTYINDIAQIQLSPPGKEG